MLFNNSRQGKSLFLFLITLAGKVHDMRSESQNTSVHAVATSLVFDRVDSSHVPDNGPQKCLADCEIKDLLKLSGEEERCTRER